MGQGKEGAKTDVEISASIGDDTSVSMAACELQSATVTKKEKHSSCHPALQGFM